MSGTPAAPPVEGTGARLAAPPHSRWTRGWRRRVGWQALSAPVAPLLVAGGVVGPEGINLLSATALSSLGPVVPVAIAALGVIVGLGVGDRRTDRLRVFAAATLEATGTAFVVAGGIAALFVWVLPTSASSLWTVAAVCGLCAATSLAFPRGNPLEPRSLGVRATEFGAVLPILAGALLLASLRSGSVLEAASLVAKASGVTLALAGAGWLLLTRAGSETEERVFGVAVLLLVGGIADALSLSALSTGLVAGLFWRFAGRHPRDTISRDVVLVQHACVVLVLIVSGARAVHTAESLLLALVYLLLRLLGKAGGATLAARVIGPDAPIGLAARLLSPGVLGVAFALNALAIAGPDASLVLSAVVAGTIAAEVVGAFLPARRSDE
jgi:hypothetical protein